MALKFNINHENLQKHQQIIQVKNKSFPTNCKFSIKHSTEEIDELVTIELNRFLNLYKTKIEKI